MVGLPASGFGDLAAERLEGDRVGLWAAPAIVYPNGKTVTRGFDSAERLASVTDWLGNKTTFGYDPDSNLQTTTFPSATGNVDSYAYDQADQLASVTISTGSSTLASLGYTRDANGQLQSETPTGVGQGNQNYSYTALNQLASINGANYSYDEADNLTQQPTGQTQSYDAANEITSITNGGQTDSYTYDGLGELTQGANPTLAKAAYTYNQAQDLTAATPSIPGASLTGGDAFSLAVAASGQVWAWGANGNGQLGNGTTTKSATPVAVTNLSGVAAVAAGSSHSLAVKRDGTVWAGGYNNDGQLGNNSTTNATTPVQVSGLTSISGVAAAPGGYHSLGLQSDGTVWAWGLNSSGQLGNNSTTTSEVPVQVSNLTGAIAIAAGTSHSLAIQSGGTVWAWGLNSSGQLGNNTTTTSKVPVQVSNLTGAIAIAGGTSHSLALKSDGTVWAWGLNSSGQLGNNSTTTSEVPVQVKNLTGVVAIAAGAKDSLALKSDWTVWEWGLNSSGQLGIGTTTNSKVPVQVKNLAGVTEIGSGGSHSLYATTTGTPSAVGLNTSGQLGNGTTTNASTAVSVTNLADVQALAPSSYTYDGDGLRASSTTAGTTQHYAWDHAASSPLLLTDGTNSYIYGPNNLPVEQVAGNGTVSYYHHDQLGSTRLLTGSTGTVTASYTYSPYGQLTSQSGSSDTPLRWAGQYQDPESGLVYLRARSYDPTTGQFITRDPLDQLTKEPYEYVNDNPLLAGDPSGLWFGLDDLVASGVGALVGGGTSAVEQLLSGNGFSLTKGAIAAGSGAAGGEASLYCGPACGGAVAGCLNDLGNQLNDHGSVNPGQVVASSALGGVFGMASGIAEGPLSWQAAASAAGGFFGDWATTGGFGSWWGYPPNAIPLVC